MFLAAIRAPRRALGALASCNGSGWALFQGAAPKLPLGAREPVVRILRLARRDDRRAICLKGIDMPLVSMRQLLDHAAENGYGIPAFNVNNLEQVQAVMTAAAEVGAPVILQASAGARKYAGEAFIKHLILAATEAYPQVPLVMHQDHGQSPDVCKGAIALG